MNRVYIDATPSSGLIGPAGDMADLMTAYLDHGLWHGRRILRPESVNMLTDTPPIDSHGLGWVIGYKGGMRFVEHQGGGPGFATTMRLYPRANLGIAILSNGTDLDRDGLTNLLQELFCPRC